LENDAAPGDGKRSRRQPAHLVVTRLLASDRVVDGGGRPRPRRHGAAPGGGTELDLRDEVAWWQTDDFWQYALFAAIACIRAAASRAGVPVRQACQDLSERPGHPTP
jgi:hypothetical protein